VRVAGPGLAPEARQLAAGGSAKNGILGLVFGKPMWRIWCKALGQKEGRSKEEADLIAVVRTAILLCYLATNCFIIAGVARHWNAQSSSQCESSVAGTVEVP